MIRECSLNYHHSFRELGEHMSMWPFFLSNTNTLKFGPPFSPVALKFRSSD